MPIFEEEDLHEPLEITCPNGCGDPNCLGLCEIEEHEQPSCRNCGRQFGGKAGSFCSEDCEREAAAEELDDFEARQPMCFAACGTPVDNHGDFCSERCDRRANDAADEEAERRYG